MERKAASMPLQNKGKTKAKPSALHINPVLPDLSSAPGPSSAPAGFANRGSSIMLAPGGASKPKKKKKGQKKTAALAHAASVYREQGSSPLASYSNLLANINETISEPSPSQQKRSSTKKLSKSPTSPPPNPNAIQTSPKSKSFASPSSSMSPQQTNIRRNLFDKNAFWPIASEVSSPKSGQSPSQPSAAAASSSCAVSSFSLESQVPDSILVNILSFLTPFSASFDLPKRLPNDISKLKLVSTRFYRAIAANRRFVVLPVSRSTFHLSHKLEQGSLPACNGLKVEDGLTNSSWEVYSAGMNRPARGKQSTLILKTPRGGGPAGSAMLTPRSGQKSVVTPRSPLQPLQAELDAAADDEDVEDEEEPADESEVNDLVDPAFLMSRKRDLGIEFLSISKRTPLELLEAPVLACDRLRVLHLSGVSSPAYLSASSSAKGLQPLNLSSSTLCSLFIEFSQFSVLRLSCPNLLQFRLRRFRPFTAADIRRLTTQCNKLTELELEGIPNLGSPVVQSTSLLSLSLSDCDDLSQPVIQCPFLAKLKLTNNKNFSSRALASLLISQPATVTTLILDGFKELTDFEASLIPSRWLPYCQTLSLRNIPSLLSPMFESPLLRSIDVSDCSRIQNIVTSGCTSLSTLLTDNTRLPFFAPNFLVDLRLPQLKQLSARQCQLIVRPSIRSQSVELFNLQGCSKMISLQLELPRLIHLDLSDCAAISVVDLSDTTCGRLRSLNLSGCLNLRSLSLRLPRLITLLLKHCKRLKTPLLSCPNLLELDISGTNGVDGVLRSTLRELSNGKIQIIRSLKDAN